jgi:hypothetical protein
MIGRTWAQAYEGDLWDLKPTANGEISDDTREAIARILVESDDLENSTAFWGGFQAGVAGFLIEHGINVDSERPSD